jgi:hypothetical protein
LLDRIDLLGNPCDLDLLVFFARHPRILLASEQLALFIGYEFTEVAASLDVLQQAGLVTVLTNPIHTARVYVFTIGDQGAGWLPDLLQVASTREGRLALVRALRERPAGDRRALPHVEQAPTAEPGSRPDPGPAKRDAAPRPLSNKRRKGKQR